MTWVLQSERVPKELCDKISLLLIKPRHAITPEMLMEQKRENMFGSFWRRLHAFRPYYIFENPSSAMTSVKVRMFSMIQKQCREKWPHTVLKKTKYPKIRGHSSRRI